ncbi:MAG: TM0106 family RecB-like putative nuclease [Actinomycetota bacterium]
MTADKPLSNRDVRRAPLLDARAATRCPLRTHLMIEPPEHVVEQPLPVDVLVRIEEGRAFEDQVMAEVAAAVGDLPTLTGDEAATLAAMASGVSVIAQAELRDHEGRRTGRPDLLVALPDPTPEGRTAYMPVEVKAHLVTAKAKGGSLGPLRACAHTDVASGLDPAAVAEVEGPWTRKRPDDLLQLAHYQRLLEHHGHAGPGWAGVIGSDRTLALVDLTAPTFQSWRNTTGRWSTLEKYDREFGFRLDVAALATDRVDGLTDEDPLVVPARSSECDRCRFEGVCAPRMEDADELTLLPKVTWDVRQRLHASGLTTRTALALADPTTLPTNAIREAADHARVQTSGVPLARVRGAEVLDLPRADVEVDVDMESTADGRVYLWGCLVTDGRAGTPPEYVPFVDFSPELDDTAVFVAFWDWLHRTRAAAIDAERSFAAYCWAGGGAEDRYLRLYGPRIGVDVESFITSPEWVDLHRVARAHVTTGGSLGLKVVAGRLGFKWRDDDPGGGQSMVWYGDAVAGSREQQRRLLDYNADDVAATRWVRERLAEVWAALPRVGDLTPTG